MGNERRFYRKHMRLKTVLRTVCLVLLTVIVLLVAVFLWFRQYIVYTEDGLYLDVPWLREEIAPVKESVPDTSVPVDTLPIENENSYVENDVPAFGSPVDETPVAGTSEDSGETLPYTPPTE